MKHWLASLDRRERLFVTAAAVVIVIAIVWFALWAPLSKAQQEAANDLARWSEGLALLRPMKADVMAASDGGPAPGAQNQSLVVIVDNSLRQRGLYGALQRSQPTPGGDGIRVEFESAAFDDLVLWLGDLHRQYGLQVDSGSFSVASNSVAGRVNSTVTLQR
jgi:general secretion pathway protein M